MGTTLLHRILGALRPSQRAMSFPAQQRADGPVTRGVARGIALGTAALALAVGAAACGDSNGLTSPASFENTTRVFSVYALSGTSSAFPAAYQFTSESLIRPQLLSNGSINFDIAFDIGADGKVRIFPARLVVPSPPNGAPSIGVLRVAQPYEQVGRAPDKGFLIDSLAVAGVGETVVFEILASSCIYGESYYAKLAIDSIIASERRMVVRTLVNRNCGYRALSEGLPKN
jgi:hypothetical protein